MSTTFDKVAKIIADTSEIDRDTITPESHTIDDLGIDSLDFLDIVFAIDKEFGIKVPLEKWTQNVNDGKVSTEEYFLMKNLCAKIDEFVAAKATLRVARRGMSPRDVVITGIGLVSSLGEGNEAHLQRLTTANPQPVIDATRFPPYTVHPLPQIDWGLQIPKRGDQRQMETWQRLGTYGAGLALDDARIKGDDALCSTMDMVVAAAGGERDEAVDAAILAASATRSDLGVLLNEKLTTELRPTLFLAQLSNLLAGNISIVHKVTGSSRTFMGEEGSGVSAVDTAAARIRAGQSTHALVGAAINAEHPDMLLSYELGQYLHRSAWRPVWDREGSEGGGVVSGSGAAFLVLESRDHADKRGAKPYAELAGISSGNARRAGDGLTAAIQTLIDAADPSGKSTLAISGASGAHKATLAERAALERSGRAIRGFSTLTGHLKEAQFPFAIALAALAIKAGHGYPAFDTEGEKEFTGKAEAVLATAIGFDRYEGAALVTAP